MSEIYLNSISDRLLGAILNQPTLLLDTKYKLDKEEFKPNKFHQIIFVCCYNLAVNNYKSISLLDINAFLEPYQAQYQIYLDNNGNDYISTITELVDAENFLGYYNDFKKLSCLRMYKENNFPIEQFWDFEKSDETNLENVNKYSIEDIIEYFDSVQVNLKKLFTTNSNIEEEYQAGTDFMETKEQFKETPLIGNSFQSEYLNGIFNGMFGFGIRVGKSGSGKSILSLGDMLKASATEYWDFKEKAFVKNKSRCGSALFINTELEVREELDPIIIAWISGVERSHITKGRYLEGEEERVDRANRILLDSGIHIADMPNFTAKALTNVIKDYVLNKGVKTVCFDYIQAQSYLLKELSSETKVPMREDSVLLTLTDRLKTVQRECNVSLISAVQTNGQEDNMEYPTEACLAGGKSQVRKTNFTMVMLPPTKKELAQVDLMIQRWNKEHGFVGFNGDIVYPNTVVHIVKGRNSEYPKNIKVFQYVDLGTGRTLDMFCTDKKNEPIKVEKLTIEYDEKEN